MSYKLVEHAGDIGIRAKADSIRELFVEMTDGFYEVMIGPQTISITDTSTLIITPDMGSEKWGGYDEMLVAWLNELLYQFDVNSLLFSGFTIVEFGLGGMEVIAFGETYNEKVHEIETQIKAVTYHKLQVEEKDGRWYGFVVLDL